MQGLLESWVSHTRLIIIRQGGSKKCIQASSPVTTFIFYYYYYFDSGRILETFQKFVHHLNACVFAPPNAPSIFLLEFLNISQNAQ